ncbi:MAG: DUF1592 domain-containing protein, partial [Planctomycetaceae bacterium]|nr:DUF1592 domain-containing protein [Planctomycetaceae bacterium]
HPSFVLGYFNAPVGKPLEHELTVWLNRNELIGFNTASLAPAANYYKPKRAMEFTGPGIVVDWLDIEGPLYNTWPPASHTLLFGELPIVEFKSEEHPETRPPNRSRPRQLGAGMNRADPEPGIWTVHSDQPIRDADRLLGQFLPRLFRRPVEDGVRQAYVRIVEQRLQAGDCFELAMRAAYRSALVSPDFLYLLSGSAADVVKSPETDGEAESSGQPSDDFALASRLSYLLWNSAPDDQLNALAASGQLRQPAVLHQQVERLLQHAHSQRFVNDFTGQWLKLYDIAATDPDRKLYPEFSPYLQDAMVAETRAYFRELLNHDLNVSHLMTSDFVMINQKLADHYGIQGVTGTQIRRVPLPPDCPRGGFLTQASVLKVTANGTTTSPVPRGAFVLARLLGEPPEPPPSNVPAIEPDVQGATTIREQLARHRDNPVCASCHQRIDPPGFALESFDVIGGFRTRYRSVGEGDPAERGAIDPFINLSFRLGKPVDSTGTLTDGRSFDDVRSFQVLMSHNAEALMLNLATQFLTYGTGRPPGFRDRDAMAGIVQRTMQARGGVRTLLHEVIGSSLFTGDHEISPYQPVGATSRPDSVAADARDNHRFLMTEVLPPVLHPAVPLVAQPVAAELPGNYIFADERSVDVRVMGLFFPERVDAFRMLLRQFPDVRLRSVDYDTAQATIQYASNADHFRNASHEQVMQRLNDRIRQQSRGLFSVAHPGKLPHEVLEKIEISISGLDCDACSLAVHDILTRQQGVVHATASFADRVAIAWIDPKATSREELEQALKKSNVAIPE